MNKAGRLNSEGLLLRKEEGEGSTACRVFS